MKTSPSSEMVHPAGEDGPGFKLSTLGGLVTIERTDEALTPYGGLAAWSAFVQRLGTIERLAQRYPGQRSSPNAAPVREVLHSFMATVLIEGRRFSHVGWLRDDPGVAAVLGLERVRGEDALPRLVRPLGEEQARTWLGTAETELYRGLPARFIGDWDSTVNTRYGQQEGAEVGYNPFKRGRPSHHPLACVAAGTRLCLHMAWRPGKAVSATGWQEAMERLWGHADIRSRLWLNRGDSGFGQESVCAWHEAAGQERPKYLFKLRLTKNVRRAIAKVPPEAWKGCPTLGTEQVAETTLQLDGWSRARRVVIARTLKPLNRGPQEEFWSTAEDEVSVYVTNLAVAEATRGADRVAVSEAGRHRERVRRSEEPVGLSGLLQPARRGDGERGAVGLADLQLVDAVCAVAGAGARAAHGGSAIPTPVSGAGGADELERTAADVETGGGPGVVAAAKGLLRAALPVVEVNCAAVGNPTAVPAAAGVRDAGRSRGMVRSDCPVSQRMTLNCGF